MAELIFEFFGEFSEPRRNPIFHEDIDDGESEISLPRSIAFIYFMIIA
jgi:hypothetical protein